AAPLGTPEPTVARLVWAAREALAQPEVQEALRKLGVTPQAGTPAELARLLNQEIAHWGEVVKRAGITPE
ncbi:MAG: tripartite tricarboxylate transporter substrate binding protein, partial [Curvibacter sp.]